MAKSLYKNFDWEKYYNLVGSAEEDSVHIVHFFNREYPWGGVTIAWSKPGKGKNDRMIEVAVSYCSKHDQFNKKFGNFNALDNFYEEKTIQVPLYHKDSAVIINSLRDMFYI